MAFRFALLLASSCACPWVTALSTTSLPAAPAFTSISRTFTGYKTEPTFKPEDFEITQMPTDRSVLSPGYIFIDPMYQSRGWGPQIYTIDGTLVWQGPKGHRPQNFHVCDYMGQSGSHLCYFHRYESRIMENLPVPERLGKVQKTYGHNLVLDQTYTQVKSFSHGFDDLSINGHAFEMVEDGRSYVTIIARPRVADLTPYHGPEEGWVRNQCIEETDVATGKEIFHWCYIDSGLEIWATHLFFKAPGQTTNTTAVKAGSTRISRSWDFLHFNAVDKNAEGDYYISARFLDQIIKIKGPASISEPRDAKPGTVLWRLGGKAKEFEMTGFATEHGFTRPHDVRAISASGDEEVISLFNNAWDGETPPSQNYSDMQFIHINRKTKKAHLLRSYPHPESGLTQGRGSGQVLPNGNILVGWGWLPHMTEFDRNGTVLYHAKFSQHLESGDREFSYRTLKSPWIGKPTWMPKLVAYRRLCGTTIHGNKPPLVAYVSWNGATEVARWRFHVASSPHGPWVPAGTFVKNDFETKVHLTDSLLVSDFVPYVSVQGVAANGEVLGGTVAETFVPNREFQFSCHDEGCREGFEYNSTDSMAWQCSQTNGSLAASYLVLILFFLFIEGIVYTLIPAFSASVIDGSPKPYDEEKKLVNEKAGYIYLHRSHRLCNC